LKAIDCGVKLAMEPGVIGPFLAQVVGRQAPQFLIDHSQQFLTGSALTVAPIQQ
jgi:hypothetical protein